MQSRWQKCALPHCHWDGQPGSIASRPESPALVLAIVAARTRRICEPNRRCLTSSTAQVWRWALVRLGTCPWVRSASFQKHPVLDSAKAQKWSWVAWTMPHANVNALGKCRIPECLRKFPGKGIGISSAKCLGSATFQSHTIPCAIIADLGTVIHDPRGSSCCWWLVGCSCSTKFAPLGQIITTKLLRGVGHLKWCLEWESLQSPVI